MNRIKRVTLVGGVLLIIGLTFISCSNVQNSNSSQLKNNNDSNNENQEYTEIDSKWEWFMDLGEYQDIRIFDENFICVQNKDGQYGFVNGNNELIVPFQYFNVLGENEDIITLLNNDKKYLFINFAGETISDDCYEDAYDFSEGMAAVKKNDKWGFIDECGNIVIDFQYDNVKVGFKNGYAAVEQDGSWFFINFDGVNIFQNCYEDIKSFSEGYAGVKLGERWGFIDQHGGWIIEPHYDDVGSFSEGLVSVKKYIDGVGMWAYINAKDEIIIDFDIYDTSEGRLQVVGEFKNGYALVSKTLYCLINKSGQVVLGDNSYLLTLGSDYSSETGWIYAYDYTDTEMKEKKYGLIDIDNNVILPFVFDSITEIKDGLVVVSKEQKMGILRYKSTI